MFKSTTQTELSFLQTLVNENYEQKPETPDSDKENGAVLKVNTVGKPSVILNDEQTEGTQIDLNKSKQGFSVNINNVKSGEKDDIWDGFLPDEDIQGMIESMETNKGQLGEGRRESLEEKNEEKITDVNGTFVIESDVCMDKRDESKREKYVVKGKKRGIKETKRALTSAGGSHPELCSDAKEKRNLDSQDETMSEASGKVYRRLGRRKQATRPKCAGPAPSKDILLQKIEELHALMVKPLTEPLQYIHQTRQELLRLQGVSQQHAAQIMERQALPKGFRRGTQQSASAELTSDTSDSGYPALRAAQTSGTKQRRPWTATQVRRKLLSDKDPKQRPFSAGFHEGNTLPAKTKYHRLNNSFTDIYERGRSDERGSKESSIRSSNYNVAKKDKIKNSSVSENDNEESKSSQNVPNQMASHTDTHLTCSNNPALKKWLRQKNKEHRRQKTEEKKKLKEEREKEGEAVRAKLEMFKDSDKKVKEWTAQKRKEALENAKEKRRLLRQEKEINERNQWPAFGALRSQSLELSSRSQTPHNKKFTPIIRPEIVVGETSSGVEQTSTTPNDVPYTETDSQHPPTSKFVYGRPVSGRVRLIKLQQKQKSDAKKTENEKKLMEEKQAEDKARKMRLSYDQWLLKKRGDNYAKRQDIARQKALAKSDPELERIIPEIARRRIESTQRGKKRIDTGITIINDEVNRSFGGFDFHAEPGQKLEPEQTSGKLELLGQQKTIKQRPFTAKQSLSPKESKSPRRPPSAFSHSQTHKDDDIQGEANPFRLPFPPQTGAPKYVISKQKKLFSLSATQDKASTTLNCSDLVNKATLKKSDPVEETSTIANGKEPVNETIQDSIAGLEGPKDLDVKYEPAVEEKSFFVTHGNIHDVGGNFQEIEEELLEDLDDSKQLFEELDGKGKDAEQADVLGDHKVNESHDQAKNTDAKIEERDGTRGRLMDEVEESRVAEQNEW